MSTVHIGKDAAGDREQGGFGCLYHVRQVESLFLTTVRPS